MIEVSPSGRSMSVAAFHGRPQLAEQLTTALTAVVRSGRVVETT